MEVVNFIKANPKLKMFVNALIRSDKLQSQ